MHLCTPNKTTKQTTYLYYHDSEGEVLYIKKK